MQSVHAFLMIALSFGHLEELAVISRVVHQLVTGLLPWPEEAPCTAPTGDILPDFEGLLVCQRHWCVVPRTATELLVLDLLDGIWCGKQGPGHQACNVHGKMSAAFLLVQSFCIGS